MSLKYTLFALKGTGREKIVPLQFIFIFAYYSLFVYEPEIYKYVHTLCSCKYLKK